MPVRRVRGSVVDWEAERRVMAALPRAATHGHGMAPSSVAGDVWPGHDMSPQGAAFAVGRILRRMQRRGLVQMARSGHGWVRT